MRNPFRRWIHYTRLFGPGESLRHLEITAGNRIGFNLSFWYDEALVTGKTQRRLLRESLATWDFPSLGTFDDDPGGPWRAPGIPCECAAGTATTCPAPCPHHLSQRPGQEPADV